MTKNDTDFFFRLLGVICRFSINIRIEVHFYVLTLGNERTLVACKSSRSTSRFTRFTRDQCPFISRCKQKSVLQSRNKSKYSIFYSIELLILTIVVVLNSIIFTLETCILAKLNVRRNVVPPCRLRQAHPGSKSLTTAQNVTPKQPEKSRLVCVIYLFCTFSKIRRKIINHHI